MGSISCKLTSKASIIYWTPSLEMKKSNFTTKTLYEAHLFKSAETLFGISSEGVMILIVVSLL